MLYVFGVNNIGKEGIDEMATARRVLEKVRDIRLQLRREELDQYFSNGCFYSYSNIPLIGWLQNWKDLYKKDG